MSMIKGKELNADVNVNTSHDYTELPDEEF